MLLENRVTIAATKASIGVAGAPSRAPQSTDGLCLSRRRGGARGRHSLTMSSLLKLHCEPRGLLFRVRGVVYQSLESLCGSWFLAGMSG